MGYDVFNHKKTFEAWKKDFLDSMGKINPKYIEAGLTKENTGLFIQYILDMEQGINISNKSVKGARSAKTLNRLRSKLKSIMIGFQNKGFKDIKMVKPGDVNLYFKEWIESGHTNDYAKRFRAFWNWWMKKNRREGKLLQDIAEDLNTATNKESKFVWLTREEFDEFRKYFDEQKQLCLMFCWDSLVRAPSELFGLKVENVYMKGEEIWLNIPDEISKTFGRQFNLIYCGEELLKHIKYKKTEENIFNFSYVNFTRDMQKVAKQLWDNKKSQGGEYYKNITLYDLRHSGAISLRQIFQKSGQSLDSLRHRAGWTNFRMIDYYTKFLGLDGHINKEKTLLQEDKTKLEKEIEKQYKKYLEEISSVKQTNEDLSKRLSLMKEEYDNVFQGKNFMKLFISLAKKQDKMSKQLEQVRKEKFDIVLKS